MSNTESNREKLLTRAMIYEQTEMFDQMKGVMKEIASSEDRVEFNDEERKLLSNAYKSVIGKKRASWRKLSSLGSQVEEGNQKKMLLEKYLATIAEDLNQACEELLELLDNHLLPKSLSTESTVFFLKMKADHLRYLVEIAPENSALKERSREAYSEATMLSEGNLGPANPVRLGLALNYSVFVYEIEGCTQEAYEMANNTFQDALREIEEQQEEETCEDATTMLQLLRDNLMFWSEDL